MSLGRGTKRTGLIHGAGSSYLLGECYLKFAAYLVLLMSFKFVHSNLKPVLKTVLLTGWSIIVFLTQIL